MAIVHVNTTDQRGRIYKKIFANFEQGAIVSEEKVNQKYLVKPNLAIRKGAEIHFKNEVVLQLIVSEKLEKYPSRAGKDHIETYFPLNEETLEFFESITKLLRKELHNDNK